MSTTTRTEDPGHAIARFASRVHLVLDTLTSAPAWSMTPAEQRAVLVDLARAEARLAAPRLRVLAAADRNDIAADSAATSTGLAGPAHPAHPGFAPMRSARPTSRTTWSEPCSSRSR